MKSAIFVLCALILISCKDNSTQNTPPPDEITVPEWLIGTFSANYGHSGFYSKDLGNINISYSNKKIVIDTYDNICEFEDSYILGKKDSNYFLIHDNKPQIAPPGNEDSVFVSQYSSNGINYVLFNTNHFLKSYLKLWH